MVVKIMKGGRSCWRRWRDDRVGTRVDDLRDRLDEMEREVASVHDHVVLMHARIRMVQQELERASEESAHIEFLSHQYAFVSFLPSIGGVLVAVGVLTLADLDPVPFLMVVFAGILSTLSPVLMLIIGRQYRREAPDRIQALRRRARRRAGNENGD